MSHSSSVELHGNNMLLNVNCLPFIAFRIFFFKHLRLYHDNQLKFVQLISNIDVPICSIFVSLYECQEILGFNTRFKYSHVFAATTEIYGKFQTNPFVSHMK
jgi:hypothetical protein